MNLLAYCHEAPWARLESRTIPERTDFILRQKAGDFAERFLIIFSTQSLIMIKRSILLFISFCIAIALLYNISHSIALFLASNLAVRESFYLTNEVHLKRSNYCGMIESYSKKFRHFQLSDIYRSWVRLKDNDFATTNYKKEHQIVSVLSALSRRPLSFKKETALYIPKTMSSYWNMTCDSHAAPLIAPAITAMAMIEGLPFERATCYTHLLEHGYNSYYLVNKKPTYLTMTPAQICRKARQGGFMRVIEITNDSKSQLITNMYDCSDNKRISGHIE